MEYLKDRLKRKFLITYSKLEKNLSLNGNVFYLVCHVEISSNENTFIDYDENNYGFNINDFKIFNREKN